MSCNNSDSVTQPNCPSDCATCTEHLTRPCCVLVEVTQRCNLGCPVCFAKSQLATLPLQAPSSPSHADPSLKTIAGWFEGLYERAGACHLQLSGGEPTLRDDLPEIIELGRERGFSYFQLNTNGLRLAAEAGYAEQLKAVGLTCVFLQLDGLRDEVHVQLRGAALQAEKEAAVAACEAARLPVVLVPTLVQGVNEDELWPLIRWGMAHSPTVRGVHIQPLARFGRFHAEQRGLSLASIIANLERESEGELRAAHFSGGGAEHEACSINAHYFITDEGRLEPSGVQRPSCCENAASAPSACCSEEAREPDAVSRAQDIQARRWGTVLDDLPPERPPAGTMDEFLWQTKARSFAITGMAFMDAETLDLERLRRCYLFILNAQGIPIPFCAYNIAHRLANLELSLRKQAHQAHD